MRESQGEGRKEGGEYMYRGERARKNVGKEGECGEERELERREKRRRRVYVDGRKGQEKFRKRRRVWRGDRARESGEKGGGEFRGER